MGQGTLLPRTGYLMKDRNEGLNTYVQFHVCASAPRNFEMEKSVRFKATWLVALFVHDPMRGSSPFSLLLKKRKPLF